MSQDKPALVEGGKLLVLSYYFPPMSVGPAFVMDALMSQFDPRNTIVFMGNPDRYSSHRDDLARGGLDVRLYDIPAWWASEDRFLKVGCVRIPLRLRAIGNVAVGLKVATASARLLRRNDVKGMLAVYPKQHFLLAACLASVASRKPLLVYFMDTYVEGLPRGRKVARLIERYVARRSAVVFAMSEPHRQQLEGRWEEYGVSGRPIVEIPHPYSDLSAQRESPDGLVGRPSIVFTGAIYDAQADAVRRLIGALCSTDLDGLEPHLHLLTQSDRGALEELGIREDDRVHIGAASRAEARSAQQQADILFLPIAFDAKRHVIETASPSKMPEYLASGRPILVHAPPDSYLARYARAHGFAEVVDEPDAGALASAVRRLATDEEHRGRLAERAAATLARHDSANVAELFRDSVSLGLG